MARRFLTIKLKVHFRLSLSVALFKIYLNRYIVISKENGSFSVSHIFLTHNSVFKARNGGSFENIFESNKTDLNATLDVNGNGYGKWFHNFRYAMNIKIRYSI